MFVVMVMVWSVLGCLFVGGGRSGGVVIGGIYGMGGMGSDGVDGNVMFVTCINGIKDVEETDIDCGGSDCVLCGWG